MKGSYMNYYDIDSLSRALGKLEERYGLSSEQFMLAHRCDDPTVAAIPGFARHLWASLFLDVERMQGNGPAPSAFVDGVDRALALH
ncbi:MAG: hypothetical protein JSS68_18315 [Actinobacteria bacterium]|nr:hypothetical protein [Actinomycetota bacterium]